MSAPRFIAIEGIDGSGKSTQAALLATALGPDVVLTREPGGTPAGERIRSLLLLTEPGVTIGDRTEALLMAAARAEHVEQVVRPALAAGRTVVSDRYVASSLAYQGAGRELGVASVQEINDWATGGLWPDLTVLVRVEPAVAWERIASAHRGVDRLEGAGLAFLERAAAGFDALAAAGVGGRWVVVDGTESIAAVAAAVAAAVLDPRPG